MAGVVDGYNASTAERAQQRCGPNHANDLVAFFDATSPSTPWLLRRASWSASRTTCSIEHHTDRPTCYYKISSRPQRRGVGGRPCTDRRVYETAAAADAGGCTGRRTKLTPPPWPCMTRCGAVRICCLPEDALTATCPPPSHESYTPGTIRTSRTTTRSARVLPDKPDSRGWRAPSQPSRTQSTPGAPSRRFVHLGRGRRPKSGRRRLRLQGRPASHRRRACPGRYLAIGADPIGFGHDNVLSANSRSVDTV